SARLAQQIDLKDQFVDQPRERSYKVRKGDSLASIAKRNGMTADALARLNGLALTADPRAGRTLRLPDQPATRVAARGAAGDAGEPSVVAAVPAPASTPASVAETSVAPASTVPAPQEQVSQ